MKTSILIATALAFSTPALADCNPDYLVANAVFLHATVECKSDFMDTPGGYYALAMSRQCRNMSEAQMMSIVKRAMLGFDGMAKREGKGKACRSVYELERSIEKNVDGPGGQ